MVILSSKRVDDGQYHQILINRNRNTGQIIVDDMYEKSRNGMPGQTLIKRKCE